MLKIKILTGYVFALMAFFILVKVGMQLSVLFENKLGDMDVDVQRTWMYS